MDLWFHSWNHVEKSLLLSAWRVIGWSAKPLFVGFFWYWVTIMQKFVHQSIWYHSSLCFKYILVSSSFSSCSSKWTEKTKKNIESNFLRGDSNLPTFLSKVTYLEPTLPTNQFPTTRPNLTVAHGVRPSQRVPMASLSSATLAKSSLERVPGVP